jgi:hypothetical protein
MTIEQIETINAAIDEAIEALPAGNDRELRNWVMANRYSSFTNDIREALFDEGLKDLIGDRRPRAGAMDF